MSVSYHCSGILKISNIILFLEVKMITPVFDRVNESMPIYIRLYESIRQMIISGEIKAGERLPSKRSLASHLGLSVKTVENAYYQLVIEGYVISKEKSGFYVSNLDHYMTRSPRQTAFEPGKRGKQYIVDLKSNKNPKESFPKSVWKHLVRNVLTADPDELYETVPFNGLEKLRIAIAEYLYAYRGMNVSPDQIIIGSGTEYLYSRLLQLFDGDRIFALEDPGYSLIRKICGINKTPYISVPVDEKGINMVKLCAFGANMLHTSPAHHFPLGFVTPIDRRIELLEWMNAEKGRYIIEDDYNSEYRYHGNPVPSLYSISINQGVIYMNTFSKAVMPSIRISYMVLPTDLMQRYMSTVSVYSCTVASLEQLVLADFISNGYLERYINRIKRQNISKREILYKCVGECSIKDRLDILGDLAGTHFIIRVDTALTDEELLQRLKDKGVLIWSVLSYMEKPDKKYRSMLVVNYSGLTEEGMRYFIQSLGEVLD